MVREIGSWRYFLLNCPWDMEGSENICGTGEGICANLSIKFYVIDGIKIGKKRIGLFLSGRINTVLQSAFFKLANIIPEEHAIKINRAFAKLLMVRWLIRLYRWTTMQSMPVHKTDLFEIEVPRVLEGTLKMKGLFTPEVKAVEDVVDFVKNIQAKSKCSGR